MGVLSNCYIDATGALISGGGHVPCLLGYVHVLRSTPLAIGAEGKFTVSGAGVVVDNAAGVHCGVDDVGTGATVTALVLCNAQITNVHGTLTSATGYQLTIANQPTSPIPNLWAFRALDYSTSYATNYPGYECDITEAANHLCVYSPGTALWKIMGRTLIGTLTDDGVNKLQVTGNAKVTGTITATGQGTMPSYAIDGTAVNAPHQVKGSCTLSSNQCTVNFTNAAVFTSSSTYNCAANDDTGATAVRVAKQSGTQVIFASTAVTDAVEFICTGN